MRRLGIGLVLAGAALISFMALTFELFQPKFDKHGSAFTIIGLGLLGGFVLIAGLLFLILDNRPKDRSSR
jgi:hypothetical protein